jgi:hypothetical protein
MTTPPDGRVKACRWLFYMSLAPIAVLFLFPPVVFSAAPMRVIFSLEVLASLTVGVLFALFFLGVSVYGALVDTRRRRLYVITTLLMSAWISWAVISWTYIEYMDYLLR